MAHTVGVCPAPLPHPSLAVGGAAWARLLAHVRVDSESAILVDLGSGTAGHGLEPADGLAPARGHRRRGDAVPLINLRLTLIDAQPSVSSGALCPRVHHRRDGQPPLAKITRWLSTLRWPRLLCHDTSQNAVTATARGGLNPSFQPN